MGPIWWWEYGAVVPQSLPLLLAGEGRLLPPPPSGQLAFPQGRKRHRQTLLWLGHCTRLWPGFVQQVTIQTEGIAKGLGKSARMGPGVRLDRQPQSCASDILYQRFSRCDFFGEVEWCCEL